MLSVSAVPARGGGRTRIPAHRAFTLIELLVVVAIIAVLAGLLLPAMARAKAIASEKACSSNMHQVQLALGMYADDHADLYPLEPTEHNPHLQLSVTLETYQPGLARVLYCPKAAFSEKYAQDPSYIPKGGTDSLVDTPTNRQAGNISYIYWSFQTNKYCPAAAAYWRETANFIPRQLKTTDVVWFSDDWPKPEASVGERWVVSDFFRQGAPYPHGRAHARGLNIVYLDGHVGLMRGRPRENYR